MIKDDLLEPIDALLDDEALVELVRERLDDDATPTYSAFNKLFKVLGPKVTRAIHERVVAQAREERIAPGRMLRTDTTVVEPGVSVHRSGGRRPHPLH